MDHAGGTKLCHQGLEGYRIEEIDYMPGEPIIVAIAPGNGMYLEAPIHEHLAYLPSDKSSGACQQYASQGL
jgi:hypothetical protein